PGAFVRAGSVTEKPWVRGERPVRSSLRGAAGWENWLRDPAKPRTTSTSSRTRFSVTYSGKMSCSRNTSLHAL
ncbi:unnamed protein product, partial [Tetraodon nigroviridis]